MQCFSLHGRTETDRKRQLAKGDSDSSTSNPPPLVLSVCLSLSLSCLCSPPLSVSVPASSLPSLPSVHPSISHLPSISRCHFHLLLTALSYPSRHSSGALLIASPTRTTTRSSRQQTKTLWLVTIPSWATQAAARSPFAGRE
ncbi:hypothetical protein J3F84DRAFT_355633 [Trichoderma pleuroticola]